MLLLIESELEVSVCLAMCECLALLDLQDLLDVCLLYLLDVSDDVDEQVGEDGRGGELEMRAAEAPRFEGELLLLLPLLPLLSWLDERLRELRLRRGDVLSGRGELTSWRGELILWRDELESGELRRDELVSLRGEPRLRLLWDDSLSRRGEMEAGSLVTSADMLGRCGEDILWRGEGSLVTRGEIGT